MSTKASNQPNGSPCGSSFYSLVTILFKFRLAPTPDGGLAVSNVSSADEGRYQCVAKNVVGIRTSRKATLSMIGEGGIFSE